MCHQLHKSCEKGVEAKRPPFPHFAKTPRRPEPHHVMTYPGVLATLRRCFETSLARLTHHSCRLVHIPEADSMTSSFDDQQPAWPAGNALKMSHHLLLMQHYTPSTLRDRPSQPWSDSERGVIRSTQYYEQQGERRTSRRAQVNLWKKSTRICIEGE